MKTANVAAELQLAVLPITALYGLEISGNDIILAGVGCRLKIIDAKTRASLCSDTVLESHAIHGIVPFGYSKTKLENGADRLRFDVIVFGGRQLAWVVLDFTVCGNVLVCSPLKVINKFLARDWILVCKGSEGSPFDAVFVTSFNTLYRVEASVLTGNLKCEVLADSIGIFLYSADLAQIDGQSYLIASGTVFGQILVWICMYKDVTQSWTSIPWVQFNGHRGSIFGVEISQPRSLDGKESRDVLSCSDDRMICVWRLPGLDADSLYSGMTTTDRFLQCDQMLTKTYGHLSRIWNVSFSCSQQPRSDQSLFISAGEDGQVQSWSLQQRNTAEGSTLSLEKRYTDRYHAGKNIWAQCIFHHKDTLMFVSGGADGQLVSRYYNSAGRADTDSRQVYRSFKAIQASLWTYGSLQKSPLALKVYIPTASSFLLATTDAGHVLRCTIATESQEWEVVAQDSKCLPPMPSLNVVAEYLFFIRTSDYMLCAVEYRNARLVEICPTRQKRSANIWTSPCSSGPPNQTFRVCVTVSYHGSNDIELYWIEMSQGKAEILGKSLITLPVAFEITSLLYDDNLQILLCGSRAGALALATNVSSVTIDTDFHLCKRRVHGQDTVTSICKLESDQEKQKSFYLTTGRDGTYCIHELLLREAQEPRLTVVHQMTPPIGPSIEGAHVITRSNGSQSLLIFGFHSKNFMVWDEISQTQVMNVDCGGAHRSWMFSPDIITGQGGTFVWTKASTFMFYQQKALDHEIIQTGGHGREVKALAAHQVDQHQWLLATGSEDTDIRFFEYSNLSSNMSKLRNITVLRKHTTGLQDLQFSPDGRTLISAAGMEELYAWSLAPVPIIGQGVVFACASPGSGDQSDARIMSIDMRVLGNREGDTAPSYMIAAASSNGRLKILQLNSTADPAEMHFTYIHTLDLGTICLTQARFWPAPTAEVQSNITVLAGATNGSVRACNIPTVNAQSTFTTTSSSESGSHKVLPFHHKLHQNSIATLQLAELDSNLHLLFTGGDDNALVLTIITNTAPLFNAAEEPLSMSPSSPSKYTYRSLIIPDAHAAALTALQFLRVTSSNEETQYFRVITAGNDQRIQAWSLAIDVTMLQASHEPATTRDSILMDEVQINWLGEWYTDVADISAMEVLDNAEGESIEDFMDVLVVGVGMEILRLDLKEKKHEE